MVLLRFFFHVVFSKSLVAKERSCSRPLPNAGALSGPPGQRHQTETRELRFRVLMTYLYQPLFATPKRELLSLVMPMPPSTFYGVLVVRVLT